MKPRSLGPIYIHNNGLQYIFKSGNCKNCKSHSFVPTVMISALHDWNNYNWHLDIWIQASTQWKPIVEEGQRNTVSNCKGTRRAQTSAKTNISLFYLQTHALFISAYFFLHQVMPKYGCAWFQSHYLKEVEYNKLHDMFFMGYSGTFSLW